MRELQTRSGLIVQRSWTDPKTISPNPNPAIGTAGPNAPAGYGDTHVMYPADDPPVQASRWAGWPVEWEPPSNLTAPFSAAGRVSTVFAAIDLNARAIGSLPVYTRRERTVLEPGPAWIRNPAPGLFSGWTEAAEQMVWSFQRRGDVFLWALSRYADGTVRYFTVLNPDHVHVERGEDGYPDYSLLGNWGTDPFVASLDREDVLQISYAKPPGMLRGISPLESVAMNLISSSSATQMAGDLAARGGIPWGVMNAPYELDRDEVDALRSQWLDSAARRGGAPAITSGGFTLSSLTISPREMMLLESREFDDSRIAVALGVPPVMLGLPASGGMTYQNVTMLYDFHWRSTLRTFTRRFAEAISLWGLPYGTKLRFNPDEYTRGGIDARVDTLVKLHGIEDETGRVLNAKQIRDIEEFTAAEENPDQGFVEGTVQYG